MNSYAYEWTRWYSRWKVTQVGVLLILYGLLSKGEVTLLFVTRQSWIWSRADGQGPQPPSPHCGRGCLRSRVRATNEIYPSSKTNNDTAIRKYLIIRHIKSKTKFFIQKLPFIKIYILRRRLLFPQGCWWKIVQVCWTYFWRRQEKIRMLKHLCL